MTTLTLAAIRAKASGAYPGGELEPVAELTLHQMHLASLGPLQRTCPRLQILYLQNNYLAAPLGKQIHHLHSLQYINLALNNLTYIDAQWLSCEKLQKVDLTVNFIDHAHLQSSLDVLRQLPHLTELYLTGNPCTQPAEAAIAAARGQQPTAQLKTPQIEVLEDEKEDDIQQLDAASAYDYRLYTVGQLPLLHSLDGKELTRAEGLQAKQQLQKQRDALAALVAYLATLPQLSPAPNAYTAESRLKAYEEEQRHQQQQQQAEQKQVESFSSTSETLDAAKQKLISKVLPNDSTDTLPGQRNTAKLQWEWKMQDSKHSVELHVKLPKYLDLTLLDVDIHTDWLQCVVKDSSNLLLHLPSGYTVTDLSKCIVKRVASTGVLVVTLPVSSNNQHGESTAPAVDDEYSNDKFKQPLKSKSTVDYRHIVQPIDSNKDLAKIPNIMGRMQLHASRDGANKENTVHSVADGDDDVPPLE